MSSAGCGDRDMPAFSMFAGTNECDEGRGVSVSKVGEVQTWVKGMMPQLFFDIAKK